MSLAAYRVQQSVYDGPLDLLWYLVRQQEVNILELALAQVVEKYLDLLAVLEAIDFEQVGEFVVLASSLVEFKSQRLLPQAKEPKNEDEAVEDLLARSELMQQLLAYRQFKEASARLAERAAHQRRHLRRLANDLAEEPVAPADQPLREVELWDLVAAFSRVLKANWVPVTEVVRKDPTPITTYQRQFERLVRQQGRLSLRAIFNGPIDRAQAIGRFLAVLELIKQRRVWVEFRKQTPINHSSSTADWDDLELLPPEMAQVAPQPDDNGKMEAELPVTPPTASIPPPAPTQGLSLAKPTTAELGLPDLPEIPDVSSAWDDFESLLESNAKSAAATDPVATGWDEPAETMEHDPWAEEMNEAEAE